MSSEAAKVGVIGGGPWGIALASAAVRAKSDTLLFSRRAQERDVAGVKTTQSLSDIAKHARLIVLATPTGVVAEVAKELGGHIDGSHYLVHGVRGLVDAASMPHLGADELETVSDVLREMTPSRRVGALGGPVLVSDLAAAKPSVMVCGSRFPEVSDAFADAFGSPTLRVYKTQDLRGLEWGSALVGVLAIAVGYAQGLGMHSGLLAAFITRSVNEASRVAAAAGGDERTLLGLAGYGDLLASTSQTERPEVMLGRMLATGKSRAQALDAVGMRVEAVSLVPKVVAFADKNRVRTPIFHSISSAILEGKSPEHVLEDLMTRPVEERA
jgi:glycerol-3-phosphate dehydrogenase (NAD(P)+)